MSGSSAAARAGAVMGALTVAALPAGVAVAWLSRGVSLLEAMEVAVPAAFVLGLVTVAVVRRARFRLDRSVNRPAARVVRFARLLAWGGLYLAATGAIALGFYGLLVLRG
jgi:uncharacterized membrane protein (DUF441 family)